MGEEIINAFKMLKRVYVRYGKYQGINNKVGKGSVAGVRCKDPHGTNGDDLTGKVTFE